MARWIPGKICEFPCLSIILLPSKFRIDWKLFSSALHFGFQKSDCELSHSPHPRDNQNHTSERLPVSWIQKWQSTSRSPTEFDFHPGSDKLHHLAQTTNVDRATSAIERIVHRLQSLGLDDESKHQEDMHIDDLHREGEEKLSGLLKRNWVRPDFPVRRDLGDNSLSPWENNCNDRGAEVEGKRLKRKGVTSPTLAEMTIEETELRRLRRAGAIFKGRITVPKAGITQEVVKNIHDKWRKSELVRLKFHENLAPNMKAQHELVECRTRGFVIWRSGSVMIVYRGANFERLSKVKSFERAGVSMNVNREGDIHFMPDAYSMSNSASKNQADITPFKSEDISRLPSNHIWTGSLTKKGQEFSEMLDGLGPRFTDWWETGVQPVDADLLPPHIPGYKAPFRFLPCRMRPHLTSQELTSIRKLSKSLPCHFALGRNRNHHGLAAAIVKLWEKSTVVKIAVKLGVKNTNNKLMAEELKMLTGGILLVRNKYYIVLYRGKDFVPMQVAAALMERLDMTKGVQDDEEKARIIGAGSTLLEHYDGHTFSNTLAEFHTDPAQANKFSHQDLRAQREASYAEKSWMVKCSIEKREGREVAGRS